LLPKLNPDLLNLVEIHLVATPIIKLGRARAAAIGYVLCNAAYIPRISGIDASEAQWTISLR
jgi:hypothetical protein